MAEQQHTGGGLTRRDAMKRALRAGAYAAPVVLAVTAVSPVAAQTTPAPLLCTQPVTFFQDAILLAVAPGATFDVYALAAFGLDSLTKVGSIAADALGVAAGHFALTLDTSRSRQVTVSVYLAGTAPPAPSAADFVSTLVTTLACTVGGARAAGRMLAKIVQEPTSAACTSGVLTQWLEKVDVNLVNAQPNTAYDIYIQANNGTGGLVKAGTLTTNAQGNKGDVLPVTIGTAVGNPTSIMVLAVLAGGNPATPVFTATAAPTGDIATSGLITLSCAGTVTAFGLTRPRLIATR